MAYFPFQPGQQPMSSSQGVVIASDQTPVSVVGTVGINPASVQLLGSTNVIGSVATLQGTNPWVVQLTSGSVITAGGNSSVQVVGTMPPQSVSGVGTFNVNPVGNGSIIATLTNSSVTALQGTNPWVIGNSSVQLLGGSNSIGSVTALQGTNPWLVQLSSGSVITSGGNSSVQVVGLMPPQSVSGVGNFNVVPMGSIAGTYLDTTAVTSVTGVAILFKSSDTSSVMHAPSPSFPLPVVGSVSGTVTANPNPASVQLLGGTNVVGSVAVLQGTNPWVIGNSSVMLATGLNVVGSIAVLQGTNPWIVGNSSVVLLNGGNAIGSVTALQGTNPWVTTTSGSILGNYGVNSVFANNNTGFADWGVRNDTMASLVSADKTYGPLAIDSSGRQIGKPFAPIESSVWATASTVNAGAGTNNAASVRVFAAPGTGLKNYITDFMIANTGSVATLVSFIDNDGSVLAKTIAPAGGGSNVIGLANPIVNVSTNQPIGMISGTASSILHLWAAGYKAP